MTIAKGSFQVEMTGEPPYSVIEGVSLARARFDKRFEGGLLAKSEVSMLGVRTAQEGSAGYVATERIEGSLEGRAGTFVVMHLALMNRGAPTLSIVIVPDSGTGALAGIEGRMDIQVADGKHAYTLEYSLPQAGA